jgi:hypothetical protein
VVTEPTCTEAGFTTHICANCGESYVDDEVAAAGHSFVEGICTVCGEADPDYAAPVTVTGKSFSLSFEDEILVNFYYTVSDLTNVTEHGMLVFYSDPGTADYASADEVYSEPGYDTAKDCYGVTTTGIAAKKMGDTRYYVAYAKLTDGSYTYSNVYNYSPKKYAMNMLGRDSTSEAQKALCYEMIRDVQSFLEGMSANDEGKEEQREKNFQDLADWYGELSYTWLRIRHYASKQDYIKVYMWGIYLQHELNQVCEDFGLERQELMDYYEADNLKKIAKQADLIEVKMRQVIEAGGGKIHEYTTAEEFLDEV